MRNRLSTTPEKIIHHSNFWYPNICFTCPSVVSISYWFHKILKLHAKKGKSATFLMFLSKFTRQNRRWARSALIASIVKQGIMKIANLLFLKEMRTFEWCISWLILDLLFFLISRLNNACSPLVINLQIN